MAINHYTTKDKVVVGITILLVILAIVFSEIGSRHYASADRKASYNSFTNTITLYK